MKRLRVSIFENFWACLYRLFGYGNLALPRTVDPGVNENAKPNPPIAKRTELGIVTAFVAPILKSFKNHVFWTKRAVYRFCWCKTRLETITIAGKNAEACPLWDHRNSAGHFFAYWLSDVAEGLADKVRSTGPERTIVSIFQPVKRTTPWEPRDRFDHERAAIIRAVLRMSRLRNQIDPWLPFPQNSCTFSFGKDDRPLPIGALRYLWKKWPAFSGKCPVCGGPGLGYAFGGLLSTGAVTGCCINCATMLCRRIGGLGTIAEELRPLLRSTPFYLISGRFGGTFAGPRAPLVRVLRELGVANLPGEEWTKGRDAAGFEVKILSAKHL
jgi:hypothetical protein